MKKILAILTIIAVVSLISFTLLPPIHTPAPSFQLNDLNGKLFNNDQLKNQVTLINFWFPSCPGCVSEMPKLIKMEHDYHGKNFQIVGIAVPIDPLSSVVQYVQQREIPFTVLFDTDKSVTKKFVKTELYPTSILINQRGEILKTFVGEPNFTELYREVDAKLAQP